MGLQGAVSPARLQAHSTSALVYVAQALGGSSTWAKVMALSLALTWVYLLATSVQNAFTAVVDVSGLLFAAFYILTALATIVYLLAGAGDALVLGVLPVAAAAFLAWIIARSLQTAPASQIWSLIGVLLLGLIMLVVARFLLRSPFFHVPRESDTPGR